MVKQHEIDDFHWRGRPISEIGSTHRLRQIIVEVAQRATMRAADHADDLSGLGAPPPARKPTDGPWPHGGP